MMKYVRFRGDKFVIFDCALSHHKVATSLGEGRIPHSAGFLVRDIYSDEVRVEGWSSTLNLRPDFGTGETLSDAELLSVFMNTNPRNPSDA